MTTKQSKEEIKSNLFIITRLLKKELKERLEEQFGKQTVKRLKGLMEGRPKGLQRWQIERMLKGMQKKGRALANITEKELDKLLKQELNAHPDKKVIDLFSNKKKEELTENEKKVLESFTCQECLNLLEDDST